MKRTDPNTSDDWWIELTCGDAYQKFGCSFGNFDYESGIALLDRILASGAALSAELEKGLKPLVEAALIKDVLVAGNHLATLLATAKCDADAEEKYDDVLHDYGQPVADVWVAWAAIMALAKYRHMEGLDA